MEQQTILFDLDGTLTDPGLGITNSILYALRAMGYEEPARESLYSFIGPPLFESFVKYIGMSEAGASRAVELYREYFKEKGIYENKVYPGIPAMLEGLKNQGKRLAVATAKPTLFAEEVLSHFGLARYFELVEGNHMDAIHAQKSDIIARALRRLSAKAENALMVGDREYDVKGALACSVEPVGVLYGYGSREELTTAGARLLAEDVQELSRMLS